MVILATGDGSLAGGKPKPMNIGATNQAVMSGGIAFSGGALSYTATADDVKTGVVINWNTFRSFTVTAGNYVLQSVLSGTFAQPATGGITTISLSTQVLSHLNDATEAQAIFPPAAAASGSFSVTTSASTFAYAQADSDILYQFGQVKIMPTAAGQVFTVNLPADSTIAAVVPEPSSLTLGGLGAACLLGCGWIRRRNLAK